jgi:GT2 family glycosyltransferase
MKVAAVVVTYNRKDLLRECLQALLNQTRPLDEIIVIDNASTDGTEQMIPEEFPQVTYVRLPENIGGAGGFHEGMKLAYEKRYDWIWVMDDDVVAEPTALMNLLKAAHEVPDAAFLCSRVVSTSGNEMNVPGVDTRLSASYYPDWARLLDKGLIKVREATFVSLMVHRSTLEDVGLPVKELFIWGDDTEFTLRATQNRPAYMVGDSIVIHLRAIEAPPHIMRETDAKRIPLYFFAIRNSVYRLRKYRSRKRLSYFMAQQLYTVPKLLLLGSHRFVRVRTVFSGLIAGLVFNPEIPRLPGHPDSVARATKLAANNERDAKGNEKA